MKIKINKNWKSIMALMKGINYAYYFHKKLNNNIFSHKYEYYEN